MLKLSVKANQPAAITAALKKIREMIMTGTVEKGSTIHLVLEAGTYRETVRYNLSNPLVIESAPGTKASECVIMVENCEAFHKGLENRAVFSFGANVTNVTLRGFSIVNTHNKTVLEGNTSADSAEALVWNSPNGLLFADGMRFESKKNTLYARGFCHFTNCFVKGDSEIVYGEACTVLFEESELFLEADLRGDYDGFAVKSLAPQNCLGFVFLNCTFTARERKKNNIFVYGTAGLGSASATQNLDNAVFINCVVSEAFSAEFAWDDDMALEIFPRGNSTSGIREYNTRVKDITGGRVLSADTTKRNIKCYTLTDDDYFKRYASRYLILRDTPFAAQADF